MAESNVIQLFACVDCNVVLTEKALQEHKCNNVAIIDDASIPADPLYIPESNNVGHQHATLTSINTGLPDESSEWEFEGGKWTPQSVRQLLKAYKRHVRKLLIASSNKEKRRIWEEISSEVKMSNNCLCNPYMARMKIDNMKKTWSKHSKGLGNYNWPYQNEMSKVMEEEKAAHIEIGEKGIEKLLETIEIRQAATENEPLESEEEAPTVKKAREDLPGWFLHHEEQAEARHREKMKVLKRFINIFETIVKNDLAFELN